jgi:hypothetical protein
VDLGRRTVNIYWFIGKFIPVHAMKAYRGSRDIEPLVLNLVSIWN